jgi:alkylhydroperoxidase family enzyme
MSNDVRPPRIAPLDPPYEPAVESALAAMMPRNSPVEPLKLFRTLARHQPLAAAMHALGRFILGRELALGLRERELLIDRVCARCGCEYEWAVHALSFGARAELSSAQLAATVTAGPDAPVWTARDALLIRLVDELHDGAVVSDELWEALAAHWTTPQLLEMLVIVGWYHAIAFVANGARVPLEEWAPRFPTA